MLYDYILTAYKVLAGLITTKRLMLIALAAFGIYLVWICAALFCSFQRKFSSNCNKLYNYIRGNSLSPDNLKVIDFRIEKISNGFYYGWKKFKTSSGQKPSNFITRREALDVEVSGGVLNQGKTFMRTYIVFVTALLFIFNLAYLGSDSAITCFIIAETMVLPFIFYFVMKLFYFLYTSIKQQMYKQDVQAFYDLISLLDDTFGSKETNNVEIKSDVIVDEEGVVAGEDGELALEEEEEPEEEHNPLDDYDVFKKKNINVDELMNKENGISGTSLPYINVDSDYVIKDEGSTSKKSHAASEESASSILGGMMQNTSNLKKGENFLDVEKEVAEIDDNKVAEIKAQEEEKPAEEDPFSSFEKFEVNIESEQEKIEEAKAEELKIEETPKIEESTDFVKTEAEPAPEADSLSESEEQQIAAVVSNFKPKRSKLASGGVIIERNEPIAKRERPFIEDSQEPEVLIPADEEPIAPRFEEESYYTPEENEIKQLDVTDDADGVLNSLKTTTGGYEGFQNYSGNPYGAGGAYAPSYGQGYNPGYAPQMNPQYNQFAGMPQSGYGVYQNPQYPQNNYAQMDQNAYGEGYGTYEEPVQEEVIEETPAPKKKKVLSKEEEPRPRGLKKKETKVMEQVQPTKTRGRPKKAEVSETMTIKSEKEFDEVLARAEKLMRKSDEGLSQSQSKRIEKELKMLMDAMNRYKESK